MVVLELQKGRKYLVRDLLNLGLILSNNPYSNYIVFKNTEKYFLFKETEDKMLKLDYVSY